jgi:outer membrane protein assembly factor BamE (lipoprotein component of BamABCDE complex)
MRIFYLQAIVLLALASQSACRGAGYHAQAVQDAATGDRLTVGVVQREIRKGMSGAEVASVLGSPNIVSTDEQGREVWIYDKISTDHVYSTESGGVGALILGGGAPGAGVVGGLGSGSVSGSAGATSTTQRTLTVIIKFDEAGKVRDFAYHSSKF